MTQQKKLKKMVKIVTEVDDLGRKKFSLEEEEGEIEQQQERKKQKIIETGRFTSTLQGREQKIQIDRLIGKIDGLKKKKKNQVFYCEVCKIGFKCDLFYITHVNSVSHNRKLGMNMKVEGVSVENVVQKLAKMKEEKYKSKRERVMEKKMGKLWKSKIQNLNVDKQEINEDVNNYQIIKKNNNEEEQQNEQQHLQNNQKQEQQKQHEQESEQDIDEKMMKQLGLPTKFKSKNKKY